MPKSSNATSPLKPPRVSVGSPRATSASSIDSPNVVSAYPSTPVPAVTDSLKLILGAGGIYAAFLYYGSLQEDVFHYTSADGEKFKYAWFLQLIGNRNFAIFFFHAIHFMFICAESLSNVLIGGIGLMLSGATEGLPQKTFAITGVSQVEFRKHGHYKCQFLH